MKRIATIFLLATTLILGCDAEPAPDVVSLRQEPEQFLVAEQLVSPSDFAEVVAACAGVEDVPMTLSLSSYPFGAEQRVIGLGGSATAGIPLYECWREQLFKLGAKVGQP